MLQAEEVGCTSNRSHGGSACCPTKKPTLPSLDWKDLVGGPLVQQGWNNTQGNQQRSCTEENSRRLNKEKQSTAVVTDISPISSTGFCSSCCCCASLSHCELISSSSWCWYDSLQGQGSSGSGNYPKFRNNLFFSLLSTARKFTKLWPRTLSHFC